MSKPASAAGLDSQQSNRSNAKSKSGTPAAAVLAVPQTPIPAAPEGSAAGTPIALPPYTPPPPLHLTPAQLERLEDARSCVPVFPDDQFSAVEKDIIAEVNQLRCNPVYFAERLAREHVIVGDRLPNTTLYETQRFLRDLLVKQSERDKQFQQQKEKREADWRIRVEELNNEIAAKKKGAGKGKPVPKKVAAPPGKPKSPREHQSHPEDDLDAALAREQGAHNDREASLLLEYTAANKELTDHVNLVKARLVAVEAAVAALQNSKPAPLIEYSRGLSLAAREHQQMQRARSENPHVLREQRLLDSARMSRAANDLQHRIKTFGTTMGDTVEVLQRGELVPKDFVFHMLIKECQEPPHPLTLLRSDLTHGGCGWGRPITGPGQAFCVVTLCGQFAEKAAIRGRYHLNLSTLSHELTLTQEPGTTCIALASPPELEGRTVTALSPSEHPVFVGRSRCATLEFACPTDVSLLATLSPVSRVSVSSGPSHASPTAQSPSASVVPLPPIHKNSIVLNTLDLSQTTTPPSQQLPSGVLVQQNVFVQVFRGKAFVSIWLPSPGKYEVNMFARVKESPELAPLGAIKLEAAFNDKTVPRKIPFPISYYPFTALRCYIHSPVEHPLQADKKYTFTIYVSVDREESSARALAEATAKAAKATVHHQEQRDSEIKRIHQERADARQAYEKESLDLEAERESLDSELKGGKKTPTAKAKPRKPAEIEALLKACDDKAQTLKDALDAKLQHCDAQLLRAEEEFRDLEVWLARKTERTAAQINERRSSPLQVSAINNHFRKSLLQSTAPPDAGRPPPLPTSTAPQVSAPDVLQIHSSSQELSNGTNLLTFTAPLSTSWSPTPREGTPVEPPSPRSGTVLTSASDRGGDTSKWFTGEFTVKKGSVVMVVDELCVLKWDVE